MHVLRQASARACRPTQTQPCKVIFLYYAGTIQEQALALMGEKEAASQALEGTFDTNALRAMMNGGENDDILAALATTLESNRVNVQSAWKIRPELKTSTRRATKTVSIAQPWESEFLFDMSLNPGALPALAHA